MSLIPDDVVEQVRDAADIVGIVGEHVELKRAGADWRGPCPFHGGTHRNFAVIPKKGMFYCFVCHEVGDHLGIGLGGEPSAVIQQPVAQVGPVLDDPVEHDLNALGGVPVRVGVRLGHPAMGGPARVAYAGGAAEVAVLRHDGVAEVLKVPHRVHRVDRPVRDEGEPR